MPATPPQATSLGARIPPESPLIAQGLKDMYPDLEPAQRMNQFLIHHLERQKYPVAPAHNHTSAVTSHQRDNNTKCVSMQAQLPSIQQGDFWNVTVAPVGCEARGAMSKMIAFTPGQKDSKKKRRKYTEEEKVQVTNMRKIKACPSCKAKRKKVSLPFSTCAKPISTGLNYLVQPFT